MTNNIVKRILPLITDINKADYNQADLLELAMTTLLCDKVVPRLRISLLSHAALFARHAGGKIAGQGNLVSLVSQSYMSARRVVLITGLQGITLA